MRNVGGGLVPVAVVELAIAIDVLRLRRVYWNEFPVLRKRRTSWWSWKEGYYKMSNKKKRIPARDRRLFVRSEQRETPDLGKLSRALIALALAQAQAEAEAQAEHEAKQDEGDESHAA